MVRLTLLFFLALLILSVPEGSAGEKGNLTKLREVRIVVEDSNSHMREMGLTEDVLKKQVLALLLGKLPRVAVNDAAKPFVYVNVNVLYGTMGNRRKYYFGNVNVQVKQPVIKKNTGKEISASVWSISHVVTGPPTSAPDHVRSSLETILTSLAADWYQDNPIK